MSQTSLKKGLRGQKNLKVIASCDICLDRRLGLHWLEIKLLPLPKVRAVRRAKKDSRKVSDTHILLNPCAR